MAGLVPAIHVLRKNRKSWMHGPSPCMMWERDVHGTRFHAVKFSTGTNLKKTSYFNALRSVNRENFYIFQKDNRKRSRIQYGTLSIYV
jgi:hypothetical protein